MAGGTGGHIFPGLAVAEELKKRKISVCWLGTRQGMEAELIPKYDLPINFISVKGVRGKGLKALLAAPWRIIVSTFQSMSIMRKIKPMAVLGMGGFVSGPGALAAKLLRIPLVIHEQNAVEGLTNRLSAFLAKKILVAFPEAFSGSKKKVFTGNPVRHAIYSSQVSPSSETEKKTSFNILVLGGSRGALAINEVIPAMLNRLCEYQKINPNETFNVWHQTGATLYKKAQQSYDRLKLNVKVEPFITDIAAAYNWANIVICRSGALTVAELANVGKPSILIPYPWHKDQQQLKNAQYLEKHHAAIIIQQKKLTEDLLTSTIMQLFSDGDRLAKMSQSAIKCSKPDASITIAQICEEVLCE